MDRWSSLIDAALDRMHIQDRKGTHHAGLVSLLLELGEAGRLSEDDLDDVRSSKEQHAKVSVCKSSINSQSQPRPVAPPNQMDFKVKMTQLYQSVSKGDVQTAGDLAKDFAERRDKFKSWAGLWWTTIVSAIRHGDVARSKNIMDAALAHIEDTITDLEDSFDELLTAWLTNLPSQTILDILGGKTSPILAAVFLHLTSQRHLHIMPNIFDRLVYPVWLAAASSVLPLKSRLAPKYQNALEATLNIAQQVLLISARKDLPPLSLQQSLIIQTERMKVFQSNNVSGLIQHLPFLVVLQAVKGTAERIKQRISVLLDELFMTPEFKAAAFRQMDVLKDSFLSNEWSKPGLDPLIEAGMIDALKLIMSQEAPGELRCHGISHID
jgi:mediator of RNA polymerase II transcription subunit 12